MPTMFWMLYLWLILLVGMWLVCIIRVPAGERKGLLPAGLAVFLWAAVLFGGQWLLERRGLTWRSGPQYILCVLTWVSGLAAGVLTVRDGPKVFRRRRAPVTWGIRLFSVACLFMAMWFGTIGGGLWAAGPLETVGEYRGEKVVQGKWVWLDVSYELYEYRGALVRGSESIAWGEGPFFEEEP